MKKLLPVFFLFLYYCSKGQVRLPKLISDGMILQRDAHTRLWGYAAPGEKITLDFNGQQWHTTASNEGKWSLLLSPQKAGGPYTLQFTGSNTVTVKDVLFGDVWVCSGQSNMELTMERLRDKYADIIAASDNNGIRQFTIPDTYDFNHMREDVSAGLWETASPATLYHFSAVAYFFAREINQTYHTPIGIINAALGGSPAEAWISEEALKPFPDAYQELQVWKNDTHIRETEQADQQRTAAWTKQLNSTDEGLRNNWKSSSINKNDWAPAAVPGYLEGGNGVVWFRRTITLSAAAAAQAALLLLGRIADADSVFINGTFAGTTTYQYPPRRYELPAGILHAGSNELTVRVVSQSGKGGFIPGKPYKLVTGSDTLNLAGTWQYKRGATMDALGGSTVIRWKPAGLFNAMIAPLLPYTMKGALWYQGEANTGKAAVYNDVMRTLITDWRKRWNQGNFPFLYVQLANYMEPVTEPKESNWAALRQAQLQTLHVPNTGMAVTIDLGEWNDIHPLNKLDVGKRLALQAGHLAYGNKTMEYSGPLYQSIAVKGNQLTVYFTHTGSGLVTKDGRDPQYVAIAGEDKKFVWAKALIKGNTIVAWNDAIAHPMYIRYAWADNPEGANLCNSEQLPASPFEAAVTF